MTAQNPMQPIVIDEHGVARFKQNKIVHFLLNLCQMKGVCDLNTLALMPFDDDDRNQFAQLLGYSVSGYGDLPYADADLVAKADACVEALFKDKTDE